MKPIFLQMQAFGPFAGKETISFADLGASPLFLINGPTGSGKTTILDAISYALYGSTTGNERDARDMRCQQSDPELLTEVILEFSLGGASYRITRSPDQFRPKKRGDGVTPHKSCASLYKLGADGSTENGELLVEQKISDATDHIRSITGLNAEQFRQVMVLPQGQFRKLLMADSKDKQKIFESLFQTSVYSKIEERLKEDSRDVRDARKHAESVISNILGNGGVKTELELDEKIKTASVELKVLKTTRDDAQSAWALAEKALHDASKLKEQFDEYEKVMLREAELEADADQFQAERKRATQAHSAQKLMPVYGRVGEAVLQLQKIHAEITAANSGLVKAEASFKAADLIYQKEKNREAERASAASKVNELKSYAGKAEELTAAKAAFEAAQKSEATEKTRRAGSLKALNEHLPLEQKIQKNIDSLQQEIATADGIDVTVHKLDEALLARKKISALRVNLVQAQDALRKAETHSSQADIDCSAADKELKRMRQAWHQGQAALLAKELEDESPCPVCGSTEHPLVATASSESISDEQLDASTLGLENKTKLKFEARGNVTSCAQHVSAIEADIAQSESRLGKQAEQSEDDIAAELLSAQKVAHKLRDDVDTLEVERQSLKNHGVQTAELRENAELAKATFEKALLLTGKAQTRCELSEKLVPEAYRTVGALEKELRNAIENNETLRRSLESAQKNAQLADKTMAETKATLAQLQRNSQAYEQSLAELKASWVRALAGSEFSTEQDVQLASMSEDDLQQLDRKVSDYDKELLQNRAIKEALEKQLKGKALADLPGLSEVEEKTRSARDIALAQWRARDLDMTRLNDTKKNLLAKQKEMIALDAKYSIVGTLADVACGLKGSKISLQRYILGVLLDDVLVQSTQRLMKMSDGRYELRRKRDASKGNKASGLDLEVYDDYSGEARSVSTLSGGESFMAALSLALGLSDVVQAQTGGIQLDTLFVDEGFGTLDSEALELAVSTLMDLQQAGRMVGIISHVSELREQMDIRIDLMKSNQGGSSLKVVSPMVSGV